MPEMIACYYSLSSPWAYFGGPELVALAQRHNAKISLKPFDFMEVVPKNGGVPLRTRPQARQDYHAVELDRWRKHLNMKLNLKPKFYPTNNKPAGHMVIAAQAWGLAAQTLSHALLRALWAEEQDIALPETRIAIANALGMDGKALQAAETSDVVTGQYQANTREALEQGVFGAPSYVWRGTIFWGQDRLAFLDRALLEAGE